MMDKRKRKPFHSLSRRSKNRRLGSDTSSSASSDATNSSDTKTSSDPGPQDKSSIPDNLDPSDQIPLAPDPDPSDQIPLAPDPDPSDQIPLAPDPEPNPNLSQIPSENERTSPIPSIIEPTDSDEQWWSDTSEESESSDHSNVAATKADRLLSVKQNLQEWAIEENISHKSLSSLCRRLKKSHPECFSKLPIDARTLLKTSSSKVIVRDIPGGHYFHCGLKQQLTLILPLLSDSARNSLSLFFNIDGMSLRNSSFKQLWPILFSLPLHLELRNKTFPVGIFGGSHKREGVEFFLRPLVNELKELLVDGFMYEDKNYSVKILGFCCDSPARASVTATKGPTGYFSCPRCTIEGVHVKEYGKRIFLETNCPKRSNESFRSREHPSHHSVGKITPLVEIDDFDIVSQFVLDPMHLVFLGATKTMISIWHEGSNKPHCISQRQRVDLSQRIASMRSQVPSDFARKLGESSQEGISPPWKATEYRLFLLYVGPIVMKHYLKPPQYDHFLNLHIACVILFNAKHCGNADLRLYARQLLIQFVETTTQVYSEKYLTLNFHCLIHLVDDADYFCKLIPNFSLNCISAFPFENTLGRTFRKLVRGPAREVQQLAKRFSEIENCKWASHIYRPFVPPPKISYSDQHSDGPLFLYCREPQYKTVNFPDYFISARKPEDRYCCLDDDSVIMVENFAFSTSLNEMVVVGKRFIDLSSFYPSSFMSSCDLGIYKSKKLSERQTWKVSKICGKYAVFSDGDNFILESIGHTS